VAIDGSAVTFGTATVSEEGTGQNHSLPRPLLTVPNVTAHPSTASVPITVSLCIMVRRSAILIIIIIIIISKTMFMVLSSWQSHCESSPGSFDECRTAPSGRRPKTKPDDLSCESACIGCQSLHPPSPFIIITQPESRCSFYRLTEGRRLS